MNIFIKEAFFGLRRHPIMTGLLLIQLTVSFTLIILLINILYSLIHSHKRFSNHFDDSQRYTLSDQASDEAIHDYLNNTSSLMELKKFYSDLLSNTNYIYLECSRQMCQVADFTSQAKFLCGYEEGSPSQPYNVDKITYSDVKAVQLNENSLRYFQIYVDQGRLFGEKDMFVSQDRIPVLLGYEYSGIYHVGDVLIANYLGSKYSLNVIGILEKNSAIIQRRGMTYLDRYIVMPSLNWNSEPTSETELFTQGAAYLNKVNGTVVLREGYTLTDFVNHLENSRLSNGITFEFSVLAQSEITLTLLKAASYESFNNMLKIVIILFFYLNISLIYFIKYKLIKNIKIYKILLLCGYNNSEIKWIAITEIMILFIVSLLISLIVAFTMLGPAFQFRINILVALVSFAAVFTTSFFIKVDDITIK